MSTSACTRLNTSEGKTRPSVTQVEEHLKRLATETDEVKRSALFKQYLETMARFCRYSFHNQLLIAHQMPKATRVAGYRTWRKLKRQVKRGSHAIRILAPSVRKTKQLDPCTGNEVETEIIIRFIPVSVFDVSQTEGKPLPELSITINGANYGDFLQRLLNFCESRDIKVDFRQLGINGLYGYSTGGSIAITNTHSINTQVNTLIHEIAHELLHRHWKGSKQQAEIQAEGVAYVVTRHFGLENKSFNYLALYDADHKNIMENLEVIAGGAREVIRHLEGKRSPLHQAGTRLALGNTNKRLWYRTHPVSQVHRRLLRRSKGVDDSTFYG